MNDPKPELVPPVRPGYPVEGHTYGRVFGAILSDARFIQSLSAYCRHDQRSLWCDPCQVGWVAQRDEDSPCWNCGAIFGPEDV